MPNIQAADFTDANHILSAKLNVEPFHHAFVNGLLSASLSVQLCKEFPERDFYQSKRITGSDKTYNVANNILLKLGNTDFQSTQELSTSWKTFLTYLTSDVYNQAVSTLLQKDLSNCHLEITLKRYSRGDYISAHTDRDWVTATHLFFLNSYWEASWGGLLELLDQNEKPFCSVLPTYHTSLIFIRSNNSWHQVTPITHESESRFALQVAFWNTLDRYVLPGRKNTPLTNK